MKYEIEIDHIPNGYEPVRFGLPEEGEPYLTSGGRVVIADRDYRFNCQLIIRKVKRWRKPILPDDAGRPCRYRDSKSGSCLPLAGRHRNQIQILRGGR